MIVFTIIFKVTVKVTVNVGTWNGQGHVQAQPGVGRGRIET